MMNDFGNMDNINEFTDMFFRHIEKAYQNGFNAGQTYAVNTATVSETSANITSDSDGYDDEDDEKDAVSEPVKQYLGAYDSVAYGVYDSVSKHRNSLPYWKKLRITTIFSIVTRKLWNLLEMESASYQGFLSIRCRLWKVASTLGIAL